MTPMLEKFALMSNRDWLEGRAAKTTDIIPNKYYVDRLPEIPEGTIIVCKFAGDFGMYAMADVYGALHKVHIPVEFFHCVEFGSEA